MHAIEIGEQAVAAPRLAAVEDRSRTGRFVLGLAALAAVGFFDRIHRGIPFFWEGTPHLSPVHMVRSLVILAAVLAVTSSALSDDRRRLAVAGKVWVERPAMLAALLMATGTLLLFLFRQPVFSALSVEDAPVEWWSFGFLVASAVLLIAAWVLDADARAAHDLTRWAPPALAVVLLLIAMEEVSWFQRVAGFSTPTSFAGNVQGEFNMHNFATSSAENGYYFGAFLLLVVLPFLRAAFPGSISGRLARFAPAPFVAVVGSIASAYSFDMWDIFFTQIAFFGSVAVLIAYSTHSRDTADRALSLLALALIAVTQASFLLGGARFERIWEVTEYRELMIPMAFFIYAADVCLRQAHRRPWPVAGSSSAREEPAAISAAF